MTEYYGLPSMLTLENLRITQSDLTLFKRDRRIWFLQTYLGLRSNHVVSASPLSLGTLVHSALEGFYNGEDLLESYRKAVETGEAHYAATVEYFQPREWDKQAELGRRMLEGYLEWLDTEHIDRDIETVATEKTLAVPASSHGIPLTLTGRADHIVRNRLSGEILIYDFKTTANLERTADMARRTEQLPFYLTLLRVLEPEWRIEGAAFTLLLKSQRTERARGPFYRREPVYFTREALAVRTDGIHGTIEDYVRVLLELESSTDRPYRIVYPNPTVPWYGAEYNNLIDVIDMGGNVTGMIADRYHQEDPHARYPTEPGTMLED